MRIYVTYCSGKKDDSLKGTGIEVTPDRLYMSKNRIQPFVETCNKNNVKWAIFSDLYGIWFPDEKHIWYEKPPNEVTEQEFRILLSNFYERLKIYDEIYFYRPSPIYFHSLYRRLIEESELRDRIKVISSIFEIK